jgi:2-polyprenyl-3-methyl-5-hydroxy-6-metoxy-1,4-benzoquinol methylase
MSVDFSKIPLNIVNGSAKPVHIFEQAGSNIDDAVVQAFGEEWLKFNNFSEHDVKQFGDEYFDIAPPGMLTKQTYVLDVGCGSGRFSKYLSSQVGFIEAIDPSDAIWAAEKLLAGTPNVRLSKAAADDIPFADNTFDLVMSIGVLHHIPDTAAAMKQCVQKVKPGGHFFVYLYYNLDNRGRIFRAIFKTVSVIRRFVSTRSAGFKKALCDLIAVLVYMPVILLGRLLNLVGLKKAAEALPLSYYQDKSFFVIRNDALDRFGTRLEHRFTKQEITDMMQGAGLTDIVFSPNKPYWHAIGKRQG